MKPSKYIERDKFILDIAKGKKVLHLGCVGFSHLELKQRLSRLKDNLHNKLSMISDVIGIDNDEKTLKELKLSDYGDNIFVGDVEHLELLPINGHFNIILAGDIIEHLTNSSLMLQGIKRFCDENSIIIITTPNSFGLINILRYLFNKFREEPGHVMSFNIDNLRNLLNRYNYEIIEFYTGFQDYSKSQHNKLFLTIGKLFFKVFPKFGGTLIVLCKIQMN